MRQRVKYAIEHAVQSALQLFRVFPLKDRVSFISFSGRQYSDSPRRISELLLEQHPEIQQVWAFEDPEKYDFLRKKGVITVKYKSLKYLYYVMTSKVYVDNAEFWSALKFRPNQMVLETWHGGGAYKRVGSDRLDISALEQQHAIEKMNKITLFLSSCRSFTDFVIRGSYKYSGEVLECGLPRNDDLLHPNAEIPEKTRAQLGIPEGAKVLLYAPTFRNSHSLELYDVDFARLKDAMEQRFGGRWVIVLRMHYYLAEKALEVGQQDFIFDGTNYPDMQELLLTSDALLTDYSSSIWDFSLLGRPCFLYATDLMEYRGERDFYTPIDIWPFPIATNNDELEKSVLEFDSEKYTQNIHEHHTQLGGCESGCATEQVVRRIAYFITGGKI